MANKQARSPGNLTRMNSQGQISTKPGAAVDPNVGIFYALQKDLQRMGSALGQMANKAMAKQKAASIEAGRVAGYEADLGTTYQSQKGQEAGTIAFDGDLKSGIAATAKALGIDEVDLATVISYETAGTFDPKKKGPTTQWGQHRGLIQFGEPQAKEHGVDWNNPIASQLGPNGAVFKYLKKAGVKPGMGILDLYSAVNAGTVGRYNASDANNGGAPGTVRDKVEKQMGGHRQKALALMRSMQAGGENWEAYKADPSSANITYEEWAKDNPDKARASNPPKAGSGRPSPAGPALALRGKGQPMGPEYAAAQNRAITRRLPVEIDQQLDAIYEDFKDSPSELANAFDEAEAGVLESVGSLTNDPEVGHFAKSIFAKKRRAYERVAAAEEDKRVRDGEKGDYKQAIQSSRQSLQKRAYLAGDDEEAGEALSASLIETMDNIDAAEETRLISSDVAIRDRQDIRRTVTEGRLLGVFESLPGPEEKQAFIEELREDWKDSKGMVGELSLEQIRTLERRFGAVVAKEQRQAKADTSLAKKKMQRLMSDDLASISRDGVGLEIDGEALSFDQVKAVVGEATALEWDRKRTIGHESFKAISGLDVLPADEIADHLEKLDPKPGSRGYADQLEVMSNASKAAQGILKLRKTDPAHAVDQAFDDLAPLKDEAMDGDLGSLEELIKGRFDAQAAIGIPDKMQAPLTVQELTALAEPVANDPDKQTWLNLASQIDQTYGPFADEVIIQVMAWKGLNKDTAEAAKIHLRNIQLGQKPSRLEARTIEEKVQTSISEMSLEGLYDDVKWRDQPTRAAVTLLRDNPDKAAEFDQKYGEGAAAYYQRAEKRAEIETQKYLEKIQKQGKSLNEDGSEDYDPAKDRYK